MNNETYGIKFKAITDDFKKKLKELANDVKKMGKNIEDDTTIAPDLDTSKYSKKIEYVKRQMQDINNLLNERQDERFEERTNKLIELNRKLKEAEQNREYARYQYAGDNSTTGKEEMKRVEESYRNAKKELEEYVAQLKTLEDFTPTEDLKLQVRYEELSNTLEKLQSQEEDFNEDLEDTEEISRRSTLGEMFDKSIGKIKRFTYYLLGARSVFSLFMKYQSIYYQYNEQMQYQSELSQNAVALSLAPAFELLGNVITYVSIAFAKFIELLTGIPVLSKVTTKGIRDYNKALKESQTLASGIDEITNLSLPSGTGLASQYKALDDFQKKVAEVEKFFKKNKWIEGLAKIIRKVAVAIYDAFSYVVDNWDKLKYLFLGIGATALTFKIGMSLTGMATTLGATTVSGAVGGTGLLGIAGVMKYLGTLGLVAVGVGITVYGASKITTMLKEIKELKQQSRDITLGQLQKWPETLDIVLDRLKKTKKGTEDWEKENRNVKTVVDSVVKLIGTGKVSYENYKPVIDDIIKKLQSIDNEDYKAEIDLLLDISDYKTGVDNAKKYLENNLPNYTVNTWESLQNDKKKQQESKKVTTKGVLENAGGQLLKTGLNIVTGIKNLFGFSNGLDYVPYDEFPAILHKGEAVVPAKYNPTIHSAGNEYTNSLLETLVVKIDDLARRPNVFEIDGQQFANATYNLYEEAGNNQNYVKGVVR